MMIVIVYGEREKKNGRGETNISKVSQPPAGPIIRGVAARNSSSGKL